MRKIAGCLVACVGTALLCGCPNPNTYGTPRTVPAGKIQHTIAIEGINGSAKAPSNAPANTPSPSFTLPMAPTYQLRVGLTDDMDIGIRVANLTTLGADYKWNFLKGDGFDLAMNPGLQAFYYSVSASAGSGTNTTSASESVSVVYLHLPLLMGFNVSDSLTVVLSPGVLYAAASGTATGGSDQQSVASSGGGFGRLGVGLDARLSESFTLHPEVTAMHGFTDIAPTIIVFGLGFNFGHLPIYGHAAAAKAAPASPSAAPANTE